MATAILREGWEIAVGSVHFIVETGQKERSAIRGIICWRLRCRLAAIRWTCDCPGLIEALKPVARICEKLEVRFYVGGSLARSYHGAARSTMDVDLVTDLNSKDVDRFVSEVQDEYHVSKQAILDAIDRRSCFNLIDLSSSFKVDIFIQKRREFEVARWSVQESVR